MASRAATGNKVTERVIREPISKDNADYSDLYKIVKESGLLKKQPVFYGWLTLFSISLLGLSIITLVLVDTLWVQFINAVFMSVAFAQVAYLGHDAGHQQIFNKLVKNDAMLLLVNLLTGLDRSWWIDKHHRHHRKPNDVSFDKDVNLPFLAFTDEQARSKWGIKRFVVKYQAIFLFPLMIFEGISIRADGIQYLLKRRNVKYFWPELMAISVHLTIYFALLYYLFNPWMATAFFLVHHAAWGYYLATVFAPNHKGMPMLENSNGVDFLRHQVSTARNIRGGLLVDFYYGGLNYQIEHHLFPNMPRNNLRKVRPIVRDYCHKKSIPYHETGVVTAWKEILLSLHKASAVLRAGEKSNRKLPQ